MGESGDPRFTKALGKLMREPHGDIRARAFEALGQIRAATALACQGGEWRVAGRFNRSMQSGWRRLQLQVSSQDGKEQIQLLPTQFILTEEAKNVASYTVEESLAPDFLSIAFLFPRPGDPGAAPFNQGVLSALRWKRPSDLWSALQFIPKARQLEASLAGQKIAVAPAEPRVEEDLPLQFTCDPETARAAFLKVAPKLECSDLWGAIRRSAQLRNGPVRGKRHAIIYSQHESGSAPGYAETASAAKTSPTVVNAISLEPNAMLANLCHLTKGTFQTIDAEGEAAAAVEQMCLNLMARYTIRYQPADPEAASLAIRVQSEDGWGEVTLPIPPQAG
ncbi:MAG TPA: HEAT repeat domain-containing protein [Bryobacteraceae bacterium]|nr:HEAT repeat domain-containing protein [Bryobacteraceae bacterium]